MYSVTVTKGGVVMHETGFEFIMGFVAWMEMSGAGYLNDGCTIQIVKK